MTPLRTYEPFMVFLKNMERPFLGILAGALFLVLPLAAIVARGLPTIASLPDAVWVAAARSAGPIPFLPDTPRWPSPPCRWRTVTGAVGWAWPPRC